MLKFLKIEYQIIFINLYIMPQKCIAPGCDKDPTHNFYGKSGRLYCKEHKIGD